MAHALRRISYATCEPGHHQFSFLAREPKGHFSLQYCHSFLASTSEQAEEINAIVGNAFRMAYAAQLQRQPVLREVIASQLQQQQENITDTQRNNNCNIADTNSWKLHQLKNTVTRPKSEEPSAPKEEMNVQITTGSPLRLPTVQVKPSSIPGLRPGHTYNVLNHTNENGNKQLSQSTQSTPSSDESNSPTELNSYKRLTDKPPLIKRLAMGLTGNSGTDEDSCPLVSPVMSPESPVSNGYVNEGVNDCEKNNLIKKVINNKELSTLIELDNSRLLQSSPSTIEPELKSKRISQISSSSSGSRTGIIPTPPPLPERHDSLNNKEEGELRMAPWFQAGIPREITLEVLGREPVGAFMVRESTSKPGCFALSLRVPRDFQPTGIAHYLIMRTNKGYKIKGFTKEFTTLTSLITHHSVMQELLPCPLSLSRYNPSFAKSDTRSDFADIDLDPDYNTLADFRKMMADLND